MSGYFTFTNVYRVFSPVLSYLMVSIGYWNIFKKCGVKKRWAFIPFAREYHIGVSADREKDGRTYAIIAAFYYIIYILKFGWQGIICKIKNFFSILKKNYIKLIALVIAFSLVITFLKFIPKDLKLYFIDVRSRWFMPYYNTIWKESANWSEEDQKRMM